MLNRLALLGPVSLTGPRRSRRCVARRSSAASALLALLASSPGESVSRDRLLGLLWPDRDERTARHLLADSLYVLRQTLGDDAIVASGESLRLSPDLVWTDVVEFRTRVGRGAMVRRARSVPRRFPRRLLRPQRRRFRSVGDGGAARLRGLATRAASALADVLEQRGPDFTRRRPRPSARSSWRRATRRYFANLVRLLIAADNPRASGCGRARFRRASRARARRFTVGRDDAARCARFGRGQCGADRRRRRSARRDRQRAQTIDSVTASIIAQGRHHWHQRTRSALERAIAYFTRAVERDARAVDAWCGLADSWIVMGGRGYVRRRGDRARAASADRALALDDACPRSYASIGGLNILRRRWRDAEARFVARFSSIRENADARHWLSLTLLTGFRRREEAIREQTIAARLNPVSPIQVGPRMAALSVGSV